MASMRLLVLLCALFAGVIPAILAQTPPKTPAPTPVRQADVMAHLNAVVAWYRQVSAADNWTLQPSDDYYKSGQDELTNEVIVNAFGSARALVGVIGDAKAPGEKKSSGDERSARLATRAATNAEELANLKAEAADLERRIESAAPADQPGLIAQRSVLQARIDLKSALAEAIGKAMVLVSSTDGGGTGQSLSEEISALQRTVPELFDDDGNPQAKKSPPPAAHSLSDGLFSRSLALASFVRYRHSLELLIEGTDRLGSGADQLSKPLGAELRNAVNSPDADGVDSAATPDTTKLDAERDRIEGLAVRVKTLSAALLPLRAESIALERSRNNLTEWRASLASQTNVILRTLFVRALGLAIALIVLVVISEIWRRATYKYIRDPRRRRQLLLVRRFATATLMGFVLITAFVSDFSSLATFAGFITAGIAVALQTVILSVAAYFFLIGRFGVKVGDRVTVSGVTGDVIDIGLVRVFLMELAGTGIDLHPTGRVVVLANSALFSATPLYKQLPGTDFAWHEIYVPLTDEADTIRTRDAILAAVQKVYGDYRSLIERQHGDLERLVDYKTEVPVPTGHIRLSDTGLEAVVRYPAEIRNMTEVDEKVTAEVLIAIRADENLKKSVTAMPRIRAAVKS
jgi:small-conductance mechanosensitive channel